MIGRQFGGWGPVAVALRILGVLAVLAAISLFREAKRVLGPALVPTPMPVATATLRQDGVFGTVRHPTYLAIIVGTLGWALTWDSLPDLACAVLCSAFFIAKIQYEEGLLRDRFPEYDAYQRRVPALLPWPRR
jgi:protein-S-isoprenylcysteine O-methyltransferase Ste14